MGPGEQRDTSARGFGLLRFREFRLLWLGQFTTAMGQWMDQVARGWLIYDLTGSPFQLGLVGAIRIFPLVFLSSVAGTMADRYGRKTQLIVAQSANAVANAILGLLILHGGVEPWHVYATGLISATVQVFQNPARQSLVPEAVDRSQLTSAIGLNALAFNSSRSLGPAAAGLIIAGAGPGGSYLVQAAIGVLTCLWTAQLGLPNRAPTSAVGRRGADAESFWQGMTRGWRYAVTEQTIRACLLVAVVISLFGYPTNALLPIFAKDVLQAGPTGQGLLLAAMGVGAVLSALLVTSAGDTLPKGKLMIAGVAVYGLGAVAFAGSTVLLVSMAFTLLIGICNVAANTLNQTVLQSVSRPEMRGRVMGIYQQQQIPIALGGLAAGAMATFWGAQFTVAVFGAACTLGALAIFVLVPHLRSVR